MLCKARQGAAGAAAATFVIAGISMLLHACPLSSWKKSENDTRKPTQPEVVAHSPEQQQQQLQHTRTSSGTRNFHDTNGSIPKEGSPSGNEMPMYPDRHEGMLAARLSDKGPRAEAGPSVAQLQRCGETGTGCLDPELRTMFFALQREEEAIARRATGKRGKQAGTEES